MNNKVLAALLVCLIAIIAPLSATAKDNQAIPEYTIEGAGTGQQGTYLVKVTVISKKKNVEAKTLCRAAVHGVLFRGFSSTEYRQSQKPLAGVANEGQHADFYADFFGNNGAAASYASVVPGSFVRTKFQKEYQTSAIVTVQKEQLLQFLERQGIVRGLNSAF